MKKLIILNSLFLLTYNLLAQEWVWIQSINDENLEYAFDVKVDPCGNVYSISSFWDSIKVGNTTLNGNKDWNLLVVKWDSTGNISWANQLESGGIQGSSGIPHPSITVDRLGNAYVFSKFEDTIRIGKKILVSSTYKCLECPDSCVVESEPPIDWYCKCWDTIDCHTRNDYIVKIDSEGNYLWAKHLTKGFATGNDIHIDDNFDIYVTGEIGDSVLIDGVEVGGSSGNYIAKLDSLGNLIWVKDNFQGVRSIEDLTTDAQNNIYISGKCYENTNIDSVIIADKGDLAP